ncbi:MAG: DUF21 domain-containing protein [Alphaproteobacteria bacterium]|nr:DUF21 domain-containing protein [Alphaproteobacteria bacterium]
MIWLAGAAILALLLLSAFLSSAEAALAAASRQRIHALAAEGVRRAQLVETLHAEKDRVAAAVLLGGSGAAVVATAIAAVTLASSVGALAILYAGAGAIALFLLLGQALPRALAVHRADAAALAAAPAMLRLVRALAPASEATQVAIGAALRLVGIRAGAAGGVAEEELRGAIELHGRADEDPREARRERAMLRSILDLDEVAVGEIMIHRGGVTTLDADQPADRLVDAALASPHTRIPLWRGAPDNIIGVLHAKALLRGLKAHGSGTPLDVAAIAAKPWFIPESTTLLAQLEAFRRRREHFAIVVDEYGSLLGIVTLEDILEEIVGDIADEHDVVPLGVRPQADGSYLVAGTVTLRDLNRQLDWNLPDEAAATIAGLVLHEAQMIPDPGQIFALHGFRVEILRRQRNQLTLLRVTPPAPAALTAGEASS